MNNISTFTFNLKSFENHPFVKLVRFMGIVVLSDDNYLLTTAPDALSELEINYYSNRSRLTILDPGRSNQIFFDLDLEECKISISDKGVSESFQSILNWMEKAVQEFGYETSPAFEIYRFRPPSDAPQKYFLSPFEWVRSITTKPAA